MAWFFSSSSERSDLLKNGGLRFGVSIVESLYYRYNAMLSVAPLTWSDNSTCNIPLIVTGGKR